MQISDDLMDSLNNYVGYQRAKCMLLALRRVKRDGAHDLDMGLCYSVYHWAILEWTEHYLDSTGLYETEWYHHLTTLFICWPYFRYGDAHFPINGCEAYFAEKESGNLWRNGKRLHLMHWLTDVLEEYVEG